MLGAFACAAAAAAAAANGTAAEESGDKNCWNSGCDRPGETCYVKFKTANAGHALCRKKCPPDWLCETRVVDTGGASCGPSPLPATLVEPTAAMRELLASSYWGRHVTICDRRRPPAGPIFEATCYDGGQTGNRYIMVKQLLMRAACCAGVALLPPEFDHFPASGASCFDFRPLRAWAATRPDAERLQLGPAHASACAANISASSKRWWSPLPHSTPPICHEQPELHGLARLAATLYAGFAVPGTVFRDVRCDTVVQAPAGAPPAGRPAGSGREGVPSRSLVLHVRSGEIFSNWADGMHLNTHAGFQHDPTSRGQPPLAFYQQVARHAPPPDAGAGAGSEPGGHHGGRHGSARRYEAAVLATSPDRSNPVVGAMVGGGGAAGELGLPVSLSSTESFQADLSQMLCATNLVLARSSLGALLQDSPNVRNLYSYGGRGMNNQSGSACSPLACRPVDTAAAAAADAPAWARGDPQHATRRWCVGPSEAAGVYSVELRWLNNAGQRDEMLRYGGGTMVPPVLTHGPRLACSER